MAEFAYNNSIHASTKVSPFFANYGFHPRFNISIPETSINPSAERRAHTLQDVHRDLSLELCAAGKQYKAHTDRHRLVAPTFAVSDMVWLLHRHIKTTRPCAKPDYKNLGPFRILQWINPITFQLELEGIDEWKHVFGMVLWPVDYVHNKQHRYSTEREEVGTTQACMENSRYCYVQPSLNVQKRQQRSIHVMLDLSLYT